MEIPEKRPVSATSQNLASVIFSNRTFFMGIFAYVGFGASRFSSVQLRFEKAPRGATSQNFVSVILFDHTIYMGTSAHVSFWKQVGLACGRSRRARLYEGGKQFISCMAAALGASDRFFFWHVAFRRREGE